MSLKPSENLTDQDIQRGLANIIRDGIASHAMGVLTGGVFLVAIAYSLGASNFVIGLLAAIPPLMQLLQLPSILLVEKLRNRRLISVIASFVSRIPWLVIAISPFVFAPKWALAIVVASVAVHTGIGAISTCAWNSWMRDLIPQNALGSFFSKRMRLATILGLLLSLVGGVGIDWWKKTYPDSELLAYSILFGVGFVAGMFGVYFLSRTPEPKMEVTQTRLSDIFKGPFKNVNFKRLLIFSASWSFAVNLAAPFFTVYMLDRLQTGMSLVVMLSVVSQASNFAFLGIWGRFSDHFSNKSVLAVSGPLFMMSVLAWTFTTMPEKHVFTLPLVVLIHIVIGIATAGVNLAAGNIALKLAPRGQATSYLATNTLVNAAAATIAPILGGKFADFFATCNLALTLKWSSPGKEVMFQTLDFRHWDFFFALAFCVGMYALHRLSFVEEVGTVEEKVVRQELVAVIMRPIRSLSTAAGLFQILSFPVTAVRSIVRRI